MRQKAGPVEPRREQWSSARPTNVRRYFGPLIDFLLAFHPTLEGEASGQKLCYIRNDEMERQLLSILEHDQSQFWQVVGYKGTGKSSAIRGCFNLWDGSGVTKFFQDTLIIYCSFNSVDLPSDDTPKGIQVAIRQVLEGVLGAALDTLREEHLRRGAHPIDTAAFIDFIKLTRKDILYRYPSADAPGKSTDEAALSAWEVHDRMTYRATRLKFEMSKLPTLEPAQSSAFANSKRQILIILDDVEGLVELEARKALTKLFAPLWNCFRNGVSYPSKILLAHRPHTRDEFTRNQIWTPITIDFSASITLHSLLTHKASVWLKNHPEGQAIESRESWNDSYASLMSLLTKYGTKENQEIILALSNHCFRDSLTRLANCLQHTHSDRPIQSVGPQGSFTLPTVWPHLSRSELLETLGTRGYEHFAPDERDGLANIFENLAEDKSGDFLLPLLIHWAILQTEKYSPDWPKLIDFRTLYNHLNSALPSSEIPKRMRWAVKKASVLGLVDEVLDQFDTETVLFHVMPRAEILYRELDNNSVLLELVCGEFFMEEPELSNFRAENRGQMFRAIRFCGQIVSFERSLLEKAVSKRLLWEKVFHKRLLSRQSLSGLEGTWKRWAGERPIGLQAELDRLVSSVNKIEYDYGH